MSTQTHDIKPGEHTLQLKIPLVLPGVDDAGDGCVARLQEHLSMQRGIQEVHLDTQHGKPVLCLHYDPNLVPLEKLERIAHDEGAQITQRYRHETLTVKGMDCASCAEGIEHAVGKMPGVLSVNVNYTIERMKVEFDSTQTNTPAIAETVADLGYRAFDRKAGAIPIAPAKSREHDPAGCDSHHDHAHHKHDHRDHGGHSHGEPDANAHWLARNPEISLSLLSALLLVSAWCGERFFAVPAPFAVALYAASYVAGGYNLTRHALPALVRGHFDVEFLMLAAAVGAAILGNWAEGAFLLFLFSFGHAMEHYAMQRARNAINALGQITPKVARVRRDGGEIEIAVEELRIGDIAIVRPGDRVAVDGSIREGRSAIDQSPITGESVPVEKVVGDVVFAGSINGDGALEVDVTKLAQDTTMARVIQMVEEAQTQKSPTQTFTDTFERVFVPIVLGVVALAAVLPPLFGWLSWPVAIYRALSTLVAASPCALALSTPAAVLAGIAQAARNGVLIKGGVHLENLGSLRAIALDKTGTLTRGRPEVTDIVTAPGVDEIEFLQLAAAVEMRSSHPLAQAVVRYAKERQLTLPAAGELLNVPGRGVQCEVGGQVARIGNLKMCEESGIAVPEALQNALHIFSENGKPTMIVAHGEKVLGVLALADQLRPETPAALKSLRECGITHIIMLTGDNERVAQNVARSAGLAEVRADLLPEHKVAVIKELLAQHGRVAMIGDGVNDAPALANATVGIAMGAGGTDVALETADVALMADDLSKLPYAVALSRQSKRIIKQNVFIALGVIAILVPSTLFGFARLGIAVIFHEGSTLVVVANALRLLRFRPK